MQKNWVEPGLLPVFRWLTALEFLLVIVAAFTRSVARGFVSARAIPMFWLIPLVLGLLLFYLAWPPFQKALGRYFLPIPLIFISVGPILLQIIFQRWGANISPDSVLTGAWQLIPLLFIPLILIAWQYTMAGVVIFSLATLVIDLAVNLSVLAGAQERLILVIGIVFARTWTYLLVGTLVSQLMRSQRKQRRQLSEANAKLSNFAAASEQLTISRERNRLARELHDTLAHTLSAVSVQLEAVKVLWEEDPAQAHTLLDQTLAATRSGLTETRRALHELRASPLEDLGLPLALRSLAETSAERAGFQLQIQLPDRVDGLSPIAMQSIYRIAQEGLENISRHATASHVQLVLEDQDQAVVLCLVDNGAGFDLNQVDTAAHFGLRGMLERASVSGSHLNIHSSPGQGTTVELRVEKI